MRMFLKKLICKLIGHSRVMDVCLASGHPGYIDVVIICPRCHKKGFVKRIHIPDNPMLANVHFHAEMDRIRFKGKLNNHQEYWD